MYTHKGFLATVLQSSCAVLRLSLYDVQCYNWRTYGDFRVQTYDFSVFADRLWSEHNVLYVIYLSNFLVHFTYICFQF